MRAQLARLRSGRGRECERLANTRVAQTLGSSLLEHTVYSSLYTPTTEYYLAWQHCQALKIAMAVRKELLDTVVTVLLTRALDRVGLEGRDLRIVTRGAPEGDYIDRAFEAYLSGDIDVWGFHDCTNWWTESEKRLQKHFESGIDLY